MIRNLLYNVCPIAGTEDNLRDNIERLQSHWGTFNGRKVVLLKTGYGIIPPEEVEAMFSDREHIEFRHVVNDKVLHEVAGFLDAMESLKSLDKNEATFYAHNKGAGHKVRTDPGGPLSRELPRDVGGLLSFKKEHKPAEIRVNAIRQWRNTMYDECLSDPTQLDTILQTKTSAGCFLRADSVARCKESKWHYAGTFFWFRHDALFATNWRHFACGVNRYGVEDYLGDKLSLKDAMCLYDHNHRLYDDVAVTAMCFCGTSVRMLLERPTKCTKCRARYKTEFCDRLPGVHE